MNLNELERATTITRIEARAERLDRGRDDWNEPDWNDINSNEPLEIEAARRLQEHRASHPPGAWCRMCNAQHWVAVVGIETAP